MYAFFAPSLSRRHHRNPNLNPISTSLHPSTNDVVSNRKGEGTNARLVKDGDTLRLGLGLRGRGEAKTYCSKGPASGDLCHTPKVSVQFVQPVQFISFRYWHSETIGMHKPEKKIHNQCATVRLDASAAGKGEGGSVLT